MGPPSAPKRALLWVYTRTKHTTSRGPRRQGPKGSAARSPTSLPGGKSAALRMMPRRNSREEVARRADSSQGGGALFASRTGRISFVGRTSLGRLFVAADRIVDFATMD